VKTKKKEINLRHIVLLAFFIIFSLSLIYKYVEWDTTKKLITQYNKNWSRELQILSDRGKEASDEAAIVKDLYTMIDNSKYTYEDMYNQFDKTTSSINLEINNTEGHLSTLKKNKNELDKLKVTANFLFGQRGNFVKDLINKLDTYYDLGIKNISSSLIRTYVYKSYFSTFKDFKIQTSFVQLAREDIEKNPSKYFSMLAPLEKYTKDDYKLEKEDEIKTLYPKSYEGIMRTVNYIRSYYSVTRDYVMGDLTSAEYKVSKLNEDNMNLNFDYSILFNEDNEQKRELNKEIISVLSDSIKDIKDYRDNKLNVNVLGQLDGWMEDVVLCKLYEYKSSYYYNLTNQYPKAKTVTDLIKELSTTDPKTDAIDSRFDKNVMIYHNDDKTIKFECKDKKNNKTYSYEWQK